MRKNIFYLMHIGLILVFLNPVHSQPDKKFSLGVNVTAFNANNPGPNLGMSAIGLFNVNKFIGLYASGGFLHRKEEGINSMVSVSGNGISSEQVFGRNDKSLNYIPALLGTRFYGDLKKFKPYLQVEYGKYFSLNPKSSQILNLSSESTLAVEINNRSFRSISIGGGFTREISSNKKLDASVIFSENNFIENSFRVNIGMLWDF